MSAVIAGSAVNRQAIASKADFFRLQREFAKDRQQ
jgi:hypothetical protein